MASWWEITSSTVMLLSFLGVVYAATLAARYFSTQTDATRQTLGSRGLAIDQHRMSITTDRAAPSREEYIAQTQRAFENGAKTMSLHPDAFRHGPSREGSDRSLGTGTGSDGSSPGLQVPDQRGFQRTKKLA